MRQLAIVRPRLRLTAPPVPLEDDEQEAFIRRCRYSQGRFPELQLLYAIPNGGARTIVQAHRLIGQGVNPGVPDLCLPVPRGGYSGWYGELKRRRNNEPEDRLPRKNELRPEQVAWILSLRAQGYWANWHRGAEELWTDLEWYLLLPTDNDPIIHSFAEARHLDAVRPLPEDVCQQRS